MRDHVRKFYALGLMMVSLGVFASGPEMDYTAEKKFEVPPREQQQLQHLPGLDSSEIARPEHPVPVAHL